jgi:baculoviral IAP repeat-containing protein 6
MQLRRQRTKDRERLCESLTPQYKSNFGGLQTDGQVSAFEGLKDTHFYRESGRKTDENIGFKTLKALNREIGKILQSNLEIAAQGAVFLRFDPDAPQYMRALIAGVDGTPYSSALFSFDIYCPPDYPNVPPLVTHTTKNASFIVAPHGPGGISPNIHSDTGKVCLSLLGTWSGNHIH